jgi:hypothetical protein
MATTSSVGRETSSGSGQPDAGARHRAEHRQPCYLSIDLEDFAHDYQRSLGVEHPRRDPGSLERACARLEEFSQTHLGGARLTFFTTGQVARDYPDIVRRLSADGHEIACHYYEHDQIWHETRATFRRNLDMATTYLAGASGQRIRGFRAPDFSIDERCAAWAYEELARIFDYDSSHTAQHHHGNPAAPLEMNLVTGRLREIDIYRHSLLPGLDVRVIGGTYMRLLPITVILRLLGRAFERGFVPQVYLHPYDLLDDRMQWSRYRELSHLKGHRRVYRWARQVQWHSIGNRGIWTKLEQIYARFVHPGPLASLIDVTSPTETDRDAANA